jgi:hypothetical protein
MRNIVIVIIVFSLISFYCKKKEETPSPPLIEFLIVGEFTEDGDTLEIGDPVKFGIRAAGIDANITNFTIKRISDGETKTILDSGLNSTGFIVTEIYYQGVEDIAEWEFTVMDKNRIKSSISLTIYKDPNSTFGGIMEYSNIVMGYQQNSQFNHFFSPSLGLTLSNDSATQNQALVDILCYFNYSVDGSINKPSPTFSSPGEDANEVGDLYNIYYTFIKDWTTKNYTKYDIREINDVSIEDFNSAHNDSLLIVSYDDVWGKKKYKWATAGLIIPFKTAVGKKGLIYVVENDTTDTGKITFSMKIQL